MISVIERNTSVCDRIMGKNYHVILSIENTRDASLRVIPVTFKVFRLFLLIVKYMFQSYLVHM